MTDGGCSRQSCWSSSNSAMTFLRHALFDGLFDAQELHADIVDGEAGNFGNLAIAEAFEQECHNQPVLIRQHGDGAAQGLEALPVFQIPMRAGGRIGHFGQLLQLKPEQIGEHYGRYRLHVPEAERAMAKSLERYGQLSPVVVCRRNECYELIDGFKRLGAARHVAQLDVLSARLMEADERTVKAAIYGLNRAGGRTRLR